MRARAIKHKPVEHGRDCDQPGVCQLCDGGLFLCARCGAAEGTLTTACPVKPVDFATQQLVYNALLDYRGFRWVTIPPGIKKRVLVCGSRGAEDPAPLFAELDKIRSEIGRFVVVSGGARGADKLGETFAGLRGHLCEVFPANWTKHGNSAGYIRNKEMVDSLREGDYVVAYWDGKSPGTKSTIELAKARGGLNVIVVNA